MDSFAKLLRTLLDTNSVPISSISKRNSKKLRTLFDTNVLEVKSIGAGKSVFVNHHDYLESYAKKHYPSGLDAAITGTKTRADSIAVFKDSKRSYKSDREVVLIRTFSNQESFSLVLNGHKLPVQHWCKKAGCAAMQIKDSDSLSVNGSIGTVENLELFWGFEKLNVDVDLIFWTGGRMSTRFLDCLQVDCGFQIIHFGDYDPVGVDEYLRLKGKYHRASFHIPENLEVLFKKYGNEEILQKSQAIYKRLRGSQDKQVKNVVSLMSRYNCGLEQEALLI